MTVPVADGGTVRNMTAVKEAESLAVLALKTENSRGQIVPAAVLTVVVEQHAGIVAGNIGCRQIVPRIFVGDHRFIHIFHGI